MDWQDTEPFIGPSPELPDLYHREPALLRRDKFGNQKAHGTGCMNCKPKITKEPAVQAMFRSYIRNGQRWPDAYYARRNMRTHTEELRDES